jgi:hypothetical protein
MSRWKPGQPVVTDADEREWRAWRKSSKLAAQRERRERSRRIDYYPCEEAQLAIDARTSRSVGGDYSSVIDALILKSAFRNTKQ